MSLAKDILHLFGESRLVKVVRSGQVKRRLKPKKGYKVVGNKYVRMSSKEKRNRALAAKRGSRKRKAKSQTTANRKRKFSLRKRKKFGG